MLAHSILLLPRKQDPGPIFPWKKLYDEYQIGMWYDEAAKQTFLTQAQVDFTTRYNDPAFIFMIQTALQKFGYGLELTGNGMMLPKKQLKLSSIISVRRNMTESWMPKHGQFTGFKSKISDKINQIKAHLRCVFLSIHQKL
jgi:hypothetical protein